MKLRGMKNKKGSTISAIWSENEFLLKCDLTIVITDIILADGSIQGSYGEKGVGK